MAAIPLKAKASVDLTQWKKDVGKMRGDITLLGTSLATLNGKKIKVDIQLIGGAAALSNIHALTAALSALGAAASGLPTINLGGLGGGLGGLAAGLGGGLGGGLGLSGTISQIKNLAAEADGARLTGDLFNRTVNVMGLNLGQADRAAQGLADRLKVTKSVAQGGIEILLRQGFTIEQANESLTRAAASGLLAKKTASESFEALSDAVASGLSARLNTIKISQNLSTYFDQARREAGLASVDLLTGAQKAAATLKLLRDATSGEYENLDNLLGGVTGSSSALATSIDNLKISIGKDFAQPVNQANKFLTTVLQTFTELDPTVRRFGIALVGVIGGVAVIVSLGTAAAFAAPLFVALGASIVAINPLLLIAAGITAALVADVLALNALTNERLQLEQQIADTSFAAFRNQYGAAAVSTLNQILVLTNARRDEETLLQTALERGDVEGIAQHRRTIANLTEKRQALRATAKEQIDANQAAQFEKVITEALAGSAKELKKAGLSDYQAGLADIKSKFDDLVTTAEKIKALNLRGVALGKVEDGRKAALDALEKETSQKLGKDLTTVTKANAKAEADAMEDGLAKKQVLREIEISDVQTQGKALEETYAGLASAQLRIQSTTAERVRQIRQQGQRDDQDYIDSIVKTASDAAGKAGLELIPEGDSRLVAAAKLESEKLRGEYAKRLAQVAGNIAAEQTLRADQAVEQQAINAKLSADLKKSGQEAAKATAERLKGVEDASRDASERIQAAREAADQAAYQRQLQLATGNAQRTATVETQFAQLLLADRVSGLRLTLDKERTDLGRSLNDRLQDEKLTAGQRNRLTADYLRADSALLGKFYTDQSTAAEEANRRVSHAVFAAAQEQVAAGERTLSSRESALQREKELLNAGTDRARALEIEQGLRDTYADQARSIGDQLSNRATLRLTEAQVSDLREKQLDLAQKGVLSLQQEAQARKDLLETSRSELVTRREAAVHRQQEFLGGQDTPAARLASLNLEQSLRDSYADQVRYIGQQLGQRAELKLSESQINTLSEQRLDLTSRILKSVQDEAKARKTLYTDGVAEIMARREFQLAELEFQSKDAVSTGERIAGLREEAPLLRERIALQQAYVAQLRKSGTATEIRQAQTELRTLRTGLTDNAKAQAEAYSKLGDSLGTVADQAVKLRTILDEARKVSSAQELQQAYDGLYSAQRRTDAALSATVSTLSRVSATARQTGGVLNLTEADTKAMGAAVEDLNTALEAEVKAAEKLNTQYDQLGKTAKSLREYASGVSKESGDQTLLDSARDRALADYTRNTQAAQDAIRQYGASSGEAATALGRLADARTALNSADDDATGNRQAGLKKQIDVLKRAKDEATKGFDGDAAAAISQSYDDQLQAKQDSLDLIDADLENRKRARAAGEKPFAQQALSGADQADRAAEQVKAKLDQIDARIQAISQSIPQGFEAGLRTVSGQLRAYGNEWGAILASSASAAFSQQFSLDLSKIRAGVTSVSQTVVNNYSVQVSGSNGKVELTDPEARRLAQQLCEVTSRAKRQGRTAQGG